MNKEQRKEIREGRIKKNGEEVRVKIIDHGEGFENGNGVPNHDKVQIVYPQKEE